MQKFTRPITREVEFSGLRLAVTFAEQGITVRPVGSRRPPREISWAALFTYLTGRSAPIGQEPTSEEMTAAANAFKTPERSGHRAGDDEHSEANASPEGESASEPQPAAHGAGLFEHTPGAP